MPDTEAMLHNLASSSRDLCAVLKNGMTTGIIKVQPGYESMIEGPMGAVTMITDMIDGKTPEWTGSLDEAEVEVEEIMTVGDERHETGPTGCKLTHKPTGIVRVAEGSGNFDRNKESAWGSLSKAVEKRYREMKV
jgi:hypothetical protein